MANRNLPFFVLYAEPSGIRGRGIRFCGCFALRLRGIVLLLIYSNFIHFYHSLPYLYRNMASLIDDLLWRGWMESR